MDAHHLFERHREEAERVVVAQVVLLGEGQTGEVVETAHALRGDPGLVKEGFVEGDAIVDPS